MTALAAIRSSAAAAEELSRDRLADDLRPLRDALGPRALRPRMSMAERAAWSRLKMHREEAIYHQSCLTSLTFIRWDAEIRDAARDAWALAYRELNNIRSIRRAERRMERFG